MDEPQKLYAKYNKQTQKNKYCTILIISNIYSRMRKFIEIESRLEVTHDWREGRIRNCLMSRISVGGWEKGLEIDSGILKNGLKWQSLLYVF